MMIAPMSRCLKCLPILLIALCGCGEPQVPTGRMTGRITFGGEPVNYGTINFRNVEKGVVAAQWLGSDGEYSLISGGVVNIPVGDYAITIEPPEPIALDAYQLAQRQMGEPVPVASPEDQAARKAGYPKIPKKFREASTSPLKATINKGDNTFSVDLKE